ncbi:hypothetical protein G6F31_019473 [Rhizopus arrhizus]|nr:hypothetical protein G6F31_019473 [Rhizopus arrhizus]
MRRLHRRSLRQVPMPRPPNIRRTCRERGDLGGGSGRRPRHPLWRATTQAVPAGGRADPARPHPGRAAGASGRGRGNGGGRAGRRRLAGLERVGGQAGADLHRWRDPRRFGAGRVAGAAGVGARR